MEDPIIIIIGIVILLLFVLLVKKGSSVEKSEKDKLANMSPEELEEERNRAKKKSQVEVNSVPDNVSCPFCKGKNLEVRNPISALGWALIIIGLLFTPIFGVGLILILIGIFIKVKKFYCSSCQREF